MVNATLVNATTISFTDKAISYTMEHLLPRLYDLISAPWQNPDMIWILSPMLITLLLMEFYFGRYTKEELGWNTAVGNALVLIFVSIDLFRHIFTTNLGVVTHAIFIYNLKEIFIASIIGLSAIWLLLVDFFHLIPKRLAFFISSSLPINLIAYLGIVVVYSNFPLDNLTILAALVLLVILHILFGLIHFIEPKYKYEEKTKPQPKPPSQKQI